MCDIGTYNIPVYRETRKYTKKEIKEYLRDIEPLKFCKIKGIYPNEQFKQVYVNGYYTPYIISSYGRLFSVDYHLIKGLTKEILPSHDKDGYCVTSLNYAGINKTYKIHRLVATVFIPNPDNKPQVNHLDGVKTNNYIWNLEWATTKENVIHAYKINLHDLTKQSGENIWNHRYNTDQIKMVCSMIETNKSVQEISDKTGVEKYTISDILAHRKWKHVSKDYDFSKYDYGRSPEEIRIIQRVCELLESNKYRQCEIAKMTGVSDKKVFSILTRHSEADISKDYDFSKYDKTTTKLK